MVDPITSPTLLFLFFVCWASRCGEHHKQFQEHQIDEKKTKSDQSGGRKGHSDVTSESTVPGTRLIVTSCARYLLLMEVTTCTTPRARSLGKTRSSDLREMICALTAEHQWLVRRCPGICSHTGRRVRDGQQSDFKINEIELN